MRKEIQQLEREIQQLEKEIQQLELESGSIILLEESYGSHSEEHKKLLNMKGQLERLKRELNLMKTGSTDDDARPKNRD